MVASRTEPGVEPNLLFLAARFAGKSLLATHQLSHAHRTLVGRFTTMLAPRDSLSFNRRLTKATVQAPSPFSGAASFRRARRPRPWRGDLTAELIGDTIVPLTGAGLKAELRRFPSGGFDPLAVSVERALMSARSAQPAR